MREFCQSAAGLSPGGIPVDSVAMAGVGGQYRSVADAMNFMEWNDYTQAFCIDTGVDNCLCCRAVFRIDEVRIPSVDLLHQGRGNL